jgi:hypothetical protein
MNFLMDKATVSVVVHAHYLQELRAIAKALSWLTESKTLVFHVSVFFTKNLTRRQVYELLPRARVFKAPDFGRNFGTLLEAKKVGVMDQDFVLHLHTKRSAYTRPIVGRTWFWYLLLVLTTRLRLGMTTNSLYYPPLSLLFKKESRFIWSPVGQFSKPEVFMVPRAGCLVRFPIGGMFLAKTGLLSSWLDLVSQGGPIFKIDIRTHGETEHFLERHLGFYASRLFEIGG